MSLSTVVLRAIPGAYMLNSGIGKLGLPAEAAAGLQAMAAKGVPALGKMTPEQFAKFLSYGEIAVGGALLLPVVPTRVAGAGLAVFSGALMAMYFRTPELTEADGIRPSQEGTAISKDSWLFAIAAALMVTSNRSRSAD